MILYKYCDERIDLLRNTRIKVSNLFDINDPFEFLPQFLENFSELDRMLDSLYEYQKENYRILSLSQSECNVVMWRHYCNKHKGILYKIDTTKIVPDGGIEDPFVEVTYAKDRPSIDLQALAKALEKKETDELEASVKLITYTKFEDWKYEREYRAIVQYDQEEGYDYYNNIPEFHYRSGPWHEFDLGNGNSCKGIASRPEVQSR
ncbi:MAG: DUF2971 domain-containing protein [Desulfobacterales bacterium]